MLSQRIGDRYYPPVKSCKPSPAMGRHPQVPRLKFPPTEATLLSVGRHRKCKHPSNPGCGIHSQRSNWLFTLVENLAGVPAACQCSWYGLVGANRLQSRSNLSQDTITPSPTQTPSSTPTVKPSTPSPQFSAEEQNRKEIARSPSTAGY